MRDNVTPFRRPKPPAPRLNLQSPRGKAVLVEAMTAGAFALAFVFAAPPLSYLVLIPGVAAAAVAVQNRAAAMPWARTHHEFALRTLIIGMVALTLLSVIGLLSSATAKLGVEAHVPIMATILFWLRVAICVWAGARALIGTVLAVLRRPIPHPTGLLI